MRASQLFPQTLKLLIGIEILVTFDSGTFVKLIIRKRIRLLTNAEGTILHQYCFFESVPSSSESMTLLFKLICIFVIQPQNEA